MIKFHLINYSFLKDEVVEGFMKNFVSYLKEQKIEQDFEIEICGEDLKNRFNEILSKNKGFALNNLIVEVSSYFDEITNGKFGHKHKFIFLGEQLVTEYPWGDAIVGFITVISYLEEKVIWHEVAHLIGAEDHYNRNTSFHEPLEICSDSARCIMTWGKTEGILCSVSKHEIKNYIKKNIIS